MSKIEARLAFKNFNTLQEAINFAIDTERELKHINKIKGLTEPVKSDTKCRAVNEEIEQVERYDDIRDRNKAKMSELICSYCKKPGFFERQ